MSCATNEAQHAVQSFAGSIYIGTDPQGAPGSHNFNGMIDEVAAFNRSLSAADLQALYGSANGAVSLNLSRSGENLQLTWPFGTLLESTSLLGPWTTNSATSPYVLSPDAPQKFFRVITK
jgi:hypothetical protein